ncbi:MAG TPA: HAMP domain-containing sensor histidine kinase [Thermodesulfovibrionales bacterium]|nr:HAMP domain-containing sensor histidine kinase [Thermodesulfovibrionales bacterium]
MTECAHRESNRNCPISKTPCLGECIYANILDDISLGIIGLDIAKREVFFQNKSAVDIFKGTIKPKDYNALASLLIPGGPIESGSHDVSRTIRYGRKFVGCTIYIISERYLWIYVSDVTEKVRLDSIAEAVNTMNNLGYIFSGIRHELGNPINSIKTTMTVLGNNIDSYSRDTVLEYINRVQLDINRVEYLLNDLRTFSLYENPDLKEVHMPSFMTNLLSIVEMDFSRNQIKIKTLFRPEAQAGYVDPRALQQVMLNILTNASDALKSRESPEITISMFRMNGRIIIKVKDNGCGIPEDHKKHLFKPFSTTKMRGTGLGLVIVKKMLTKMDGTVEIESHEGLGTTVTLNLPGGPNRISQ